MDGRHRAAQSQALLNFCQRQIGLLVHQLFNLPAALRSSFALRPQYRYLARKSPVRALCAKSFFTIPNDTLNHFATSTLVPSYASQAATILSRKSSDICFFIPHPIASPTATTIVEILSEFKRRTHIVRILADEPSGLCLIRALAVEIHEECSYLSPRNPPPN